MQNTRSSVLIVLGFFALGGIAWAQPPKVYSRPVTERNVLRFEVGYSRPSGSSNYWHDTFREFTGSTSDFGDTIFGIDYLRRFSPRISMVVSTSVYEGGTDQSYLDFVDNFGREIIHTTTLSTATFNVGLLWELLPRTAVVVPYVGFGGGYLAWELEESGDFIDFSVPFPEIFADNFVDDGGTFNWYSQFGLDFPLSRRWSIFTEGRWQGASADLGGDFQGLGTLDLSSWDVRVGGSWSF
ncbi:MAG: hypothetical protein WBH85_16085 [Thermoanaerobaculia bacterium]